MALIALLIGGFSRGWKISWSCGLILASVLVPLTEVWQRVPDMGQQLVPSQLRAQSQWDYLAVPVISEFPKSWGGRMGEYRSCTSGQGQPMEALSVCSYLCLMPF